MKLWIDTETRGPNFKLGHAKYAQTVEVIMVQWAVDDGPVMVEDLTNRVGLFSGCSFQLKRAVAEANEIWSHGDFDHTMLETTKWWPVEHAPLEKWRDTMALARMHGLPGGLDKLCEIFKVKDNEAKDQHGKA